MKPVTHKPFLRDRLPRRSLAALAVVAEREGPAVTTVNGRLRVIGRRHLNSVLVTMEEGGPGTSRGSSADGRWSRGRGAEMEC